MIEYANELFKLLLYAGLVLSLTAVIVLLSYILGERHSERATGEPYESGIASTGSARLRFSEKFYVIAMFFVIFDLETVFFVAWAVSFREAGWAGYAGILIFVLFLISVFIYEWRAGAFDFAASGRKIIKAIQRLGTDEHR